MRHRPRNRCPGPKGHGTVMVTNGLSAKVLGCHEWWGLSVGDTLAVTAAPGANHFAVAVRDDDPEGSCDLIDLTGVEGQNFLAQTSIAVEPAWVFNEERFDAIGIVHYLVNRSHMLSSIVEVGELRREGRWLSIGR